MAPTPLQSLWGLRRVGRAERILAGGILAAAAATIGFALRGHRQTVGSAGLMMCALGLIFDIAGAPQSAQRELWGHGSAALGLVLVSWGAIKILLDAADAAARRGRAHFSTIFKDLLTILLFAVVVITVLVNDFRVDPTPLLASSAVVAAVLGFALQETLGNVFSGLTLPVGEPVEPGDWARSAHFVSRVQEAVGPRLWYARRRKEIEIPFPIRTLRLQREKALTAETEAFEREIMGELRQVDFLRGLRDEELRLLLPGVTAQQFGRGEVIVREGDNGNSLYIVRSGTVEGMGKAYGGKQVHMVDLTRPAFFGEMALMTGEPRTATIRARTDSELLELSRDGFTELFKSHPETASQIGEVIALRNTERRALLASAPHGDGVYSRSSWLLAKIRSVFDLAGLR